MATGQGVAHFRDKFGHGPQAFGWGDIGHRQLLARSIAAVFDAYFSAGSQRHAKAI